MNTKLQRYTAKINIKMNINTCTNLKCYCLKVLDKLQSRDGQMIGEGIGRRYVYSSGHVPYDTYRHQHA
jgi:hypothetical protein